MKRIIKRLAGGLGATSLTLLLFGATPAVAAPADEPPAASFQAPTKRLVLDSSPIAQAQGDRASALAHSSHFSHSSHHSHYSGR